MIADRVIRRRRQGWQWEAGRRTHPAHAGHRQPRRRDAGQRRELPDQEAVHGARRDPDREPGPHLTLLHRPRSGDQLRPRRRHHLPAGPAERRLHRHRGLQHGRVPPGRLPVGDGGQGARGDGDPRRPAVHPHQRAGRPARAAAGRAPTSPSSAGSSTTSCSKEKYFREYVARLHQRRRRSSPRTSPTPRTWTGSSPAWTRGPRCYDFHTWQYEGTGGPGRVRGAGPGVRGPGRDAGTASAAVRPGRPAVRRTAPAARPCAPGTPSGTRRCSTRAACSRSSSGTSPATPRRWWSRSAASRRTSSAGSARRLTENSGRDRTTAFVYSVGWTQHTVGVQYIRTASILQPLLGNIGRPGGGILALRGHASIQGSTDIPTLFNLLPGYIPMPHAHANEDLDTLRRGRGGDEGLLGEHARLHGEPAQGLVGRGRARRTTTSASTTCPGSPAATAPTRP